MIYRQASDFLPGRIVLEPGTRSDYRRLERFHYVPSRPATWAAVCVARYLAADEPARVIGVAVLSYPSALHRARHRTFGLKPLRYGARLRWTNANLRTISRVIVHPQFRSIGLSTRMIHWLCAECPTPHVEALATMGWVHPFFDRAGMTRIDPEDPTRPVYYHASNLHLARPEHTPGQRGPTVGVNPACAHDGLNEPSTRCFDRAERPSTSFARPLTSSGRPTHYSDCTLPAPCLHLRCTLGAP